MINHYYYDGQIRRYLLQFCNIFAGLQVQTGKGTCDEPEFITVPISIASRDRVVAAINSGNTQNKPFTLPAMSAMMVSMALAPERRKGVGVIDRNTVLPEGGVFPNDLVVIERAMPIPYDMTVELSLYASNTQQLHQMLEQILPIFDPKVQIQTNDSAYDWTKITMVELVGINNEENVPAGNDRRTITWSLTFEIPIWLSIPMDVRNDIVENIIIQIGDLQGFQVNEFDEDGNMVPFAAGYQYATVTVNAEST